MIIKLRPLAVILLLVFGLRSGQQIAQFEDTGTFNQDWTMVAVTLRPDRMREDSVVKLWPVYTLDRIDDLLAAACQRLRPYLTHNPDLTNEDRGLCEGR